MDLGRIHRIHLKGELGRAEGLYRAVPPSPHRDYLLGTLYLQKEQAGLCSHYMESALGAEKTPHGYTNIVSALRKLGRVEEGIEIGMEAIWLWGEQDPRLKGVYTNLGSCYIELGEYEKGEAIYRKLLELDAEHADGNWNMGICQLSQGNWEGWQGFDYGFKAKERGVVGYFDEFDEYLGQDLTDKTILVWGEQGLGDEILFAGCIPDLVRSAGAVIYDCHPRLKDLFARSFDCEVTGGRKDRTPGRWDLRDKIDFQCPVGSLPRFFRTKDEDFPDKGYLKPDPERVAYWKNRYPGIRVGLSWRGGVHKTGGSRRSVNLADLLPPPMEGVTYISLQYGEVYEEVCRQPIVHEEWAIEDFTELANLTAACDLVISVIQTNVHLAGAMDIPTWCLTPQAPPWKFLAGEKMIWHPSVRQFHQAERGDWGPVIQRIHSELRSRYGNG